MSYELYWYVDKRVIGTRYEGEVTLEEMVANGNEMEAYLQTGEPPLFLLIDMRDIKKFPLNFKSMLEGMETYRSKDNPVGWTIVISRSRFFSFFGVMASKVVGVPMHSCQTLEEANAFILHHAPELAPELALEHASG